MPVEVSAFAVLAPIYINNVGHDIGGKKTIWQSIIILKK